MTQDEFFKLIAEKSDITYSGVEEVMKSFVEAFQECVIKRESIIINNIGALEFSTVKERQSSKLLGSKTLPETERAYFHLSNNLKKLFKK